MKLNVVSWIVTIYPGLQSLARRRFRNTYPNAAITYIAVVSAARNSSESSLRFLAALVMYKSGKQVCDPRPEAPFGIFLFHEFFHPVSRIWQRLLADSLISANRFNNLNL